MRARARYVLCATGLLSAHQFPDYTGVESFQGMSLHSARWPKEPIDFTGKRVGIIGTGSSGIQSVPVIAEQAAHLYVFQRTPNFSVPARNMPMDPEFQRRIKADYRGFRKNLRDLPIACMRPPGEESALEATPEERQAAYEEAWQRGGLSFLGTYSDLITNKEANDTAAEFVRAKIHEIVDDHKHSDRKFVARDTDMAIVASDDVFQSRHVVANRYKFAVRVEVF